MGRQTNSLLLLLSLGLVACAGPMTQQGATAGSSPRATAGTRLRAVTTMSILADVIGQVGGDRVEATNVIPLGAGPENYQPTPQDAQTIARADIVFFNGHGLEGWLDKLFAGASSAVPRVDLSGDLPALGVGGANFKQGNPHFWLDPQNMMHYVEAIRDHLSALDRAGAAVYTANAASYLAQLKVLDGDLQALAGQIPVDQRKMVTNHDAFPYFARRYGFTIVGNILGNPEAELAAGDLANLVRLVKAQHVKAIFSESQFSPRVSQTLAQEAGVQVIANLYTDTLSQAGEASSYLAMMRYDMRTIVAALKGTSG